MIRCDTLSLISQLTNRHFLVGLVRTADTKKPRATHAQGLEQASLNALLFDQLLVAATTAGESVARNAERLNGSTKGLDRSAKGLNRSAKGLNRSAAKGLNRSAAKNWCWRERTCWRSTRLNRCWKRRCWCWRKRTSCRSGRLNRCWKRRCRKWRGWKRRCTLEYRSTWATLCLSVCTEHADERNAGYSHQQWG